MGQREAQVLGEELLDVGTLDIVGLLKLDDAEDLDQMSDYRRTFLAIDFGPKGSRSAGDTYVDGPETGTVAGSHVLVESLHSFGPGHLAVLLVHVVSAGARVVADPDAEVLDLQRVLLVDL